MQSVHIIPYYFMRYMHIPAGLAVALVSVSNASVLRATLLPATQARLFSYPIPQSNPFVLRGAYQQCFTVMCVVSA